MSATSSELFSNDRPGEVPVRGFLHRSPLHGSGDVLVLTHGAGGNCGAPLLVALAEAFAAAGVHVFLCDLPFRQMRPKGPPSPSTAQRDREGLRRAVILMKAQFVGRVFMGGQSYGGRQASILAASRTELAYALLLLSYPLHPPGRPAPLRTAHFPDLHTPALFVHGEADPFATTQELRPAIKLIPAPTMLLEVAGAGHGLLTKANSAELPPRIVAAFQPILQASDP